VEVISIRTPSLGDATYVVVIDDAAIVVDPQRDIDRFLEVIEERGLSVSHVLETHMHNDYISGGRDLARKTGAELVLPAAAGAAFVFKAAFHNEALDGPGGIVINPLHTPGHTPAHTSYHVHSGDGIGAVFTGGSLLVGAAGRSDLLGIEYAESLSSLQFVSVNRLAQLPDDTGVYPTHGEGSFCTATGAGRATSTIGLEKAENPVLQIPDRATFVEDQLGGLVPYPTYYKHMGPTNRLNPTAFAPAPVPEWTPGQIREHLDTGGTVLDGRDRYAFATAHIPGSIGIELGDSFAPWAGWLAPYDAPIVLVLDSDQDATLAATELARTGLDSVVGVTYGLDQWAEAGYETAGYETATASDVAAAADAGAQILDVRDPLEWSAGHVSGSVHRYLPDLLAGLPDEISVDKPVWVICRTGNRASIAAGILEQHGLDMVVVAKGGVPDLIGVGV
jgi:glyoxylase-like metal-dependent hydrolase (beta-lactamase superfamily II)/rhodanese-related sulfurtransferase